MLSSVILNELMKNRKLIEQFLISNGQFYLFNRYDGTGDDDRVTSFKARFSIISFATNFGILISKMDEENDEIMSRFVEDTRRFMKEYMNSAQDNASSLLSYIIHHYATSQELLLNSYDHCISYIKKIRGEIESQDNSTITYTFSSNLSRAENVENIIASINRTYQLLCYIAGEDADSLSIIRLETGSIEAVFKGIKKVVSALGGIYKTSLRYFIRHLHQDGAIMKNEELLRLLNSELQTYGLMKENGLDVTKIDGSLQETLQTIAINIGALAQMPTGAVRINGELIVNGDEVKNLESPDIKKLPS